MRPFFALLLTASLSGCTGDKNVNAVLIVGAETPLLIPMSIAHSLSRAAIGGVGDDGPDDPEMVAASGPAASLRQFNAPVSLRTLDLTSDGTVTGFTPQSTALMCVAGRECTPAVNPLPPPAPRAGCWVPSPDGRFCLKATQAGLSMISAATGQPVISGRLFKGAQQGITTSLRGEVLVPSPSGFDRISATETQSYAIPDPPTFLAARLGTNDSLLSVAAGNRAWGPPPMLRVIDAASGKVLQTLSLPAGTHFVFDVKFSPDGIWCAITYTGNTVPTHIALFRVTSQLTIAAVITVKMRPEFLAFDRHGMTVALLYDHERDNVYGRRITVFRLPAQSPGGAKP